MQNFVLSTGGLFTAFAAAALTLIAPPGLSAQETPPAAQPPPDISFRVLEQTRIDLGDHKLILNRVAPPVLPKSHAVVQPPPPFSAEAAETARRREGKKSAVLFLTVTVYDREVSLLRWFGEGGEGRAYSNIDFNLLGGLGVIETEDTVYSLLLGLGNEARTAASRPVPPLSQFSPARAEYFLAEDKAKPADAEALAALDALHRYYDAHRAQLAEDYKKREAARAERESQAKAHPPVPRNTVINFWPADARQLQEMQTKEGQR